MYFMRSKIGEIEPKYHPIGIEKNQRKRTINSNQSAKYSKEDATKSTGISSDSSISTSLEIFREFK